ncbi:MAG: DNA alkylation repair protein [Bacteroidales bacterium]|nr:DNA alkylation repair protein [Bacteroidales bacterium]
MNSIISEIRKEIAINADEKTRLSGERFFKEPVKLHGLKSSASERIAKEWFAKIKEKPKNEIFRLCEELWKSGYLEESGIACIWSYNIRKQYEPTDIEVFGNWIKRHVTNWATCDTLCNHSVGTLIEMYPEKIKVLKDWAKSKNRWVKRASAVTLIIPARKGMFLEDIFEIAGILLTDRDDMVQKGYGWMLKSASQANQKEVFEFVMKNKNVMPRTSLRYAIEKMPKELKVLAMAK